MLISIFSFLLDVAVGLVGGACLLRAYMHWLRMPLNVANTGPLGQFVQAITDWIVLPLRRVFRPGPNWDFASVLAAFLLVLAQQLLLVLLSGGMVYLLGAGLALVPIAAVFAFARMVISMATGLLIVYAIMSWVQPGSWMMMALTRLAEPLVSPFRRIVPQIGGVDLSVLAAIVALQIAGIVLAHLQGGAAGVLLGG